MIPGYLLQATPIMHKRKYKLWSKDEDVLLVDLKRNKLLSWKEIALRFSDRTLHACQFRWRKISPFINQDGILEMDEEEEDEDDDVEGEEEDEVVKKKIHIECDVGGTRSNDDKEPKHEHEQVRNTHQKGSRPATPEAGADCNVDEEDEKAFDFSSPSSRRSLKFQDILN